MPSVPDSPNVTELRPLYDAVAERFERFQPSAAPLVEKLSSRLGHVPAELAPHFRICIERLIADHIFFALPRLRQDLSMRDALAIKIQLRQQLAFFDSYEETTKYLMEAVGRVTLGLGTLVPKIAVPSPFTIPLSHAFPNYRDLVQEIFSVVSEARYVELNVYNSLRSQILSNLCDASNVDPQTLEKNRRKLIPPCESKLPHDQVTLAYLRKTPFQHLFNAPVSLRLTHQERFTHWHAVGGTGAGKTTLLETIILNDLKADDPPSIVVVDSQGDLINKLSRLRLFSQVSGEKFFEKVVLITPKDVKHSPAINIFDVKRLDQYDEVTKEQVLAGVLQTFDYLFDGLLGADLSAKQGVFFRMVARLMLALPKTMGRPATILDMMQLMVEPAPYLPAIRSLPRIPREFFERDFLAPKSIFSKTREEVRYRLQAIIDTPAFERLFTAPSTKVDFFDLLNKGSVILIDTAKDFLKEGSANYGRVMISLVLQAILERAALPHDKRRPTFIFIDEAHEYFDDNIDDFLTEVRKHNCGIVLGHQYLEQASGKLRASLAANTGIKFASKVSMSDARSMAPDMRTTADFIMDQPNLHFAAHIRNVTPSAVSIPVTPGVLDREPKVSDDAYAYFRALNQFRLSLSNVDDIVDDMRRARGEEVPKREPSRSAGETEETPAPIASEPPRMGKNARKREQRRHSTPDGQEFSEEW